MKGTQKKLLMSAAVLALAGVIVLAGNAVQSAKAAFNVPFSTNQQINTNGAPELGVVELKGTVDAIGVDSYTVSGLTFRFDTLTIISGAPAVGDSVEVKALTLPDLTRYALKIETMDTVITTPEFEFFGLVEAMSAGMWTISSEQVQVDLTTVVDPGIEAGALVEVKGTVVAGQMLADSIELKESMPGDVGTEIELFGTVETITGAVYMIGGKTVNTDASTEFVGAVVVGSFVKVHATLNADGTYLAREIKLISAVVVTPGDDDDQDDDDQDDHDQDDQGEDEDEQEIKITGVLESMVAGLWVVDGIEFVVDDTTKIEGDPQVGDTVKVEAHVQSDGTNLAHEIELEDDDSVGDDDDSSSDDDEDSDSSGSDEDDQHEDDDDDESGGSSGGSGDDDDDDEDDDESGSDSSGFTS
ncbi:MAG TPA: DUF5666 domain-containing protein [Bellilinea sp.]|nr:DUF5666 domain-containing protein [Bellilinea sp.]